MKLIEKHGNKFDNLISKEILSAINSLKGNKAGIENKTRLTFAEIDKRVEMRIKRKASDTMGG